MGQKHMINNTHIMQLIFQLIGLFQHRTTGPVLGNYSPGQEKLMHSLSAAVLKVLRRYHLTIFSLINNV